MGGTAFLSHNMRRLCALVALVLVAHVHVALATASLSELGARAQKEKISHQLVVARVSHDARSGGIGIPNPVSMAVNAASSATQAFGSGVTAVTSKVAQVGGKIPGVGSLVAGGANMVGTAARLPGDLLKLTQALASMNLPTLLAQIPSVILSIGSLAENLLPEVTFNLVYGLVNGFFIGKVDDTKQAIAECKAGRVPLQVVMTETQALMRVIVERVTHIDITSIVDTVKTVIEKVIAVVTAVLEILFKCPLVWLKLAPMVIALIVSIASEAAETATGAGTAVVAAQIILGLIPAVPFFTYHVSYFIHAATDLANAINGKPALPQAQPTPAKPMLAEIKSQVVVRHRRGMFTAPPTDAPTTATAAPPTPPPAPAAGGNGGQLVTALVQNKNVVAQCVLELMNIVGGIIGSLNVISRAESVLSGFALNALAKFGTLLTGLDVLMPIINKITKNRLSKNDITEGLKSNPMDKATEAVNSNGKVSVLTVIPTAGAQPAAAAGAQPAAH